MDTLVRAFIGHIMRKVQIWRELAKVIVKRQWSANSTDV